MYGASFDCDAEKKRRMNPAQQARKIRPGRSRSRPAARKKRPAAGSSPAQGSMPSSRTAAKYQNGSWRFASGVV